MLAIKKTLSYISITSLLFSNIALAGKDLAGLDQEADALLTSIRPNTFSATRAIDALHIYESGEIIAQDLEGNRSSIKPYNQPQEVKDVIQHGQLSSLLNHFNLYVTKPGEELKIQLMGGLKGGMKRVGKPENNICKYDKTTGVPGTGYCFPLSNGGTGPSGLPNKNSYVGTKRFPELMESQYGPSAKDDFTLPSDKPNPYPSNFDPLARSTDPFSPNWDPFPRSNQSHYDQFHIPTPVPQQSYTRYELEQIEQWQKKQRDLQEQRELEEQRKQQLAQLDYTLQYHKSKNVPAYTTLTSDEQRSVLDYAKDLCRKGQCKPDTDALKQAIKQVVYDTPAHHVLGWYKDREEPGVQFYKNINKKHSQQIIETAKELAYGQGKNPDSATITQAYNQVMTGELQYVFDYHRTQTKAADYQDLPPEYESTLIQEALGNMKSRHSEFRVPDTAPLTESFRYHRTLGEALLKGYGHAVDDLLCATLGSCPAHAYGQAVALAPRLLTTIGLSASTMWNGKVKNWITEGVDWIRPRLFSSPVEELAVNLSIYKTFGPYLSKSIFDNPSALRQASKLLTESEIPTPADKEIEFVDAVGGQQVDPDHEPGEDHGDDFHKKAHEDIKQYKNKTLETDKVLDKATNFLGKGYKDMGNGRFVSADRLRQIRMMDDDILGKHAGGRHINFEVFKRDLFSPKRMKRIDNIHIFLK